MKWTRFTTFATLAALTLALGAGWATAQTAKPPSMTVPLHCERMQKAEEASKGTGQ